jgi:HEAT repeat protein
MGWAGESSIDPMGVHLLYVLIVAIFILLGVVVALTLATVLLRLANARMASRWNRLEREWAPLLSQALSGNLDPNLLARRLVVQDHRLAVAYLARHARRSSPAQIIFLRRIATPLLETVQRDLSSERPHRRARAVLLLGLLADREALPILTQALEDPSLLVAKAAVRGLLRHRELPSAQEVLRHLDRFTHWSSRYISAKLASVGPSLTPSLCEVIANPKRPLASRKVATDALRKLRDPRGIELSLRLLEEGVPRNLAGPLLRYLRGVAGPEVRPLMKRFAAIRDDLIRGHALRILGKIGDRSDRSLLIEAMREGSAWTASHAARGLKEGGDIEALKTFSALDHPRAKLATQVLSEAIS